MKFIFLFAFFGILIACNKTVKKAEFEGVWINKNLLSIEKISSENLESKDIYLPLIAFKKEPQDSIKLFYSKDSVVKAWSFHIYDSYNLKLNEDRETMVMYDYPKDEVIFLDRHRNTFQRYVKLNDSLAISSQIKAYFGDSLAY